MKTLAVFMMIILAINVSNAVEPASVDGVTIGMHEGAAAVTHTDCSARFRGDHEESNDAIVNDDPASISQ